MATTITRALADDYFGPQNHVRSPQWKSFDAPLRDAAIAHAKRMVSRTINTEVTDETVDNDIYYRPDYAVYEQALYMLMNSDAVPNAERTGPHFNAVDEEEDDGIRKKDMGKLCFEAAQYLNRPKGQVHLLRG